MALDLYAQPVQTIAPPKRPRTWPGTLLLLLLPGITAETLTGSTPILIYLTNPLSFVSNTLLYGCSALLIREVVRRRNLGWPAVMLFGLAYGIFEEGLIVNTWANPWLSQVCKIVKSKPPVGLCDYSRVGGINLSWALSLTVFHAVVSITIPILLVDLLLPRLAPYPLLGRKGIVACVCGDLLVLAFGVVLNFVSFRQHGFAGPLPLPYFIEVVLMIILIDGALVFKPVRGRAPSAKPLPRLWTLRLFGFFGLLVNTLLASVAKEANVPFQIELIVNVVLLALALWRGSTWAHRAGWNRRHMLALASGALAFFFFVWDVVLEASGAASGTAIVALIYLVVLIFLARRLRAPYPVVDARI